MKLKFGEKRLTGKDKEIMEIWGSTDCYFADKEVLEIFDVTIEEFQDYLEDLYRRTPEVYLYFAECRKEMQRQRRFEEKIRTMDGNYLDEEFKWDRDQDFIKDGTKEFNIRKRRELSKSIDGEDYLENNR
jgi:PAS domain-containing protein